MILTIYMSIFLVLVCADMGIKQYIEDIFEDSEERETVIPGIVFRKVYNKGFAFNVLERAPGMIQKCSLCAAVWIFVYDCWLFTRKKRTAAKLGMALVSAGAVSNVYDRLIRGKVIDYSGMKAEKKKFSKLTANLADLYLMLGAVIYNLSRIAHARKRK